MRVDERTAELKKAQKVLASRERHFRRLIENVTDIITIVDADGIVGLHQPCGGEAVWPVSRRHGGPRYSRVCRSGTTCVISICRHCISSSGRQLRWNIGSMTMPDRFRCLKSFIERFENESGMAQFILCSRLITQRKKAEEENRVLEYGRGSEPEQCGHHRCPWPD